ncbi:unnamed protein product [Vicia faba]|uniref:Uncharacterized protein n=1 Tax=Vicia faba TaxID=3906 RepID=A0AAV0YQY0_VICFA|nr:unnamed protein product [Vicia faba]
MLIVQRKSTKNSIIRSGSLNRLRKQRIRRRTEASLHRTWSRNQSTTPPHSREPPSISYAATITVAIKIATPTSTQIATVRHCEAPSASFSLPHMSQPNSFTDAKPSFTQKHQWLSDIADVNLSPEPIASIP